MSAIELAPPPGDPDAMERIGRHHAILGAALERAAVDLEALFLDGRAHALDAVADRRLETAAGVERARGRYQDTATVLAAHAVELRQLHARANAARHTHAQGAAALHVARERAHHALAQWRLATVAGIPAPEGLPIVANPCAVDPDRLRDECLLAQAAAERLEEELAQAARAHAEAVAAIEEAAVIAAARIAEVLEQTEDVALALLAAAAALLRDAALQIADWVASVWEAAANAAEAAGRAIAHALAVLATAVALLVVVEVIASAELLLGWLALMQTIQVWMRGMVTDAADAALTAVGLDGLERVRLAMGLLMLSPAIGLFVASRLINEALKPTPKPVEIQAPGLACSANPRVDHALADPDRAAALEALDSAGPSSAADILSWSGMVDQIGAKDMTVVDVARVVGDDGQVSWIVTLPSTQDWVFLGFEVPAVNDLDADLILTAFPELASQYMEATLEAMRLAGIAAGEPVLVVGWSLGGILAGRMAESGAGGYNYAGVLAAGSPIDHMDIEVPVVQVKHQDDPVHLSDLVDQGRQDESHVELWDGVRSGEVNSPIKFGNVIGHSNADYVSTLADHLAGPQGDQIEALFADVIEFEDQGGERVVAGSIEHRQFAFSE